jgi:hypothetical protein
MKGDAAAYLGISANTFDQVCHDLRPVALAEGRTRLLRYDVVDLDAWIDRRKGFPAPSHDDGEYWLERLGNVKRSGKPH